MVDVSSLRSVLTLDDSRFKQGIAESITAMKAATTETQKMAAGLAAHLKVEAEATASAARSATVKRQEIALDRELTAARAKLSEMLAGEDKLVAQVGARYSGLSNARRAELVEVKQQTAAYEALAKAKQNAARNLQTVGSGLTSAVTVPLLGLGAAAAASGYDVQGAEAEIRTRTGAQGSQLAGLDESLKKVAVSVPQSMKTVGEAIGDVAARTGLTGKALEDLTKTELDFARITDSQVAPLIQATTQLFTAWGISARDQIPVLDLLNRAHEKTGVSAQKLAEELTRFSPVFHTMNLGIVDSVALLASFEKAGIPPAIIMRGLTQEMSRLAKVGVTDAHRAFELIIKDIEHAPNAMTAAKEATRLFGARVGNDLVQDIRAGRFSLEGLEKVLTDGSDSIEKAAKQTRTFGVVFGEFRNQVEVALAPLGLIILKAAAQVLDSLKPMLDAVKEAVDWFSQLGETGQETVLGIVLAVALLGPAAVKIGAFATTILEMRKAWLELQLVTTVATGTGEAGIVGGVAKLGFAAAATGALWVGVFGAMGLAVWGLATNFHHVRDELISDSIIVSDTIKGAAQRIGAYVRRGQQTGKQQPETLGQIIGASAAPATEDQQLRELLAGTYNDPAKAKGGAESALDKVLRDFKAEQARLKTLFSKGGAPGESDDDIRKRMASIGEKNAKLTPAQRESQALDAALDAERERHTQLIAGEGNVAAQVAGRFHLLHDARVQELIDLTTADKALEKKASANQRATQTTEQLRAKIAEMNAQIRGEPKSSAEQVSVQLAGADPKLRAGAVAAATEEAATAARLHAVQSLRQQIATVEGQIRAGRGEDKNPTTTDALQITLKARLEALTQTDKAEKAIREAAAAATKADAKAQEDLLHRLTEGAKEVGTEHAKLTGTSKELTAAQTLLNDAYNSGNPLLILWAQALEDATKANEKLAQSQKDAAKDLEAQISAWDTAGKLAAEQAKRHTELMNTSKGVTEAQVLLNAAIQDGDTELALYLDQIIKNTKANDVFAKNVAQQKRLIESVASGTAGVVANSLQNIWQHGFKNFFANVIDGFKQMFQQIALDIIRSEIQRKITDALTPKPPSGSGGSSGAGLWGELLNLGVSAATGGAGGAGGGSYDNSYGSHFASGGYVQAGVPITVGERGSETFIPPSNGMILPHGAQVQGAGVTIHQTFNIQTPSPQAFRQSQGQILADANRQAMLAARRGS